MPLDKTAVKAGLNQFFDTVETALGTEAADRVLPFIGELSGLPDGEDIAASFEELRSKILGAVDGADGPDVAQAVADAINALGLPGVSAVENDGGVDLTLAAEASVSTGQVPVDFGGKVPFLDLSVTAGATAVSTLNATLAFAEDGSVALKDQADPELSVAVKANLSINELEAELGVVRVRLTDTDPGDPELEAVFGVDFANAASGAFDVDAEMSGGARLDVRFAADEVLAELLPDVSGRLIIDFPIDPDALSAPVVEVRDVLLDLESYLGIVTGTAEAINELFDAEPLGTLIDIATSPVPVLDDLARTFRITQWFDRVGGLLGGGDGIVTLADLAAYGSPAAEAVIDPWYRVIKIIAEIRKLGDVGELGSINIGGGTLEGGVMTPGNDPAAILAALTDKLKDSGLLSDEAVDFLTDFEIETPSAAASLAGGGFTFGLFERPQDILKILLTNEPVELVKFDVPPLEYHVAAGGFFPVLGPLGFELSGKLSAGLDFDIGYDTGGLISGDLFDGFFLTTELDTNPLPPNLGVYEPVGALDTSITGGAGIGFAGSSLTVNARFDFGLYAYFEDSDGDGKFRPASDQLDCIFNPIGGSAAVSVNVTLRIGFGPFGVKKNIPLANANLGDFTLFKCPPPTVEATPEAPGLATEQGDDILLNVGARADLRRIADMETGEAKFVVNVDDPATPGNERLNEGYVIGRARDANEDRLDPASGGAPALVPGKLDVFAYGFTQRVDADAVIRADFGDGDDQLVIQADVETPAVVRGGQGADNLAGGRGADEFHGDAGEDNLAGGDGDDKLYGGGDADFLAGGKGGDLLDGGDGVDTVDYSAANRDLGAGVYITLSNMNYTGSGGEADGDVFVSVENVVGTGFADYIRATGAPFSVFLEGGGGGDVLIGGNSADLLLGGVGADLLDGQSGEDGTTYITSWNAVDIDLARTRQHGGDAQGDLLLDLEDVQGTIFNDRLSGNDAANVLDGGDGDDVMDGRGGVDTLTAGFGDDTVRARGDNDLIDASLGYDALSYERAFGPVTVDLGATQDKDGGFIAGSAPDRIVMFRPERDGVRGISHFEVLIGGAAGDSLTGDVLGNRIEGRDGDDAISGDLGFDILAGGSGRDLLNGGAGIDWVEYADSGAGVQVDIADLFGAGVGGTAEGDRYFSVENILGSRFADELIGNGADNIIDPNISGRQVAETAEGRGGVDTLRLDYSGVEADAGAGVSGGFTSFGAGAGAFRRSVSPDGDQLDRIDFNGVERLDFVGTRSADFVVGGGGADRIVTNSGDDLVFAGVDADDVEAGAGDDNVAYGAFAFNDFGDDGLAPFRLDGGRGIDMLSLDLRPVGLDVAIAGLTSSGEFAGTNLQLPSGGAAFNFERLATIWTGAGDDRITQDGAIGNDFRTGDGDDEIAAGLGRDLVDGGLNTDGLGPLYDADGTLSAALLDPAALVSAPGDLLVLDYSSLGAGQRVMSAVGSRFSLAAVKPSTDFYNAVPIFTNDGRFLTLDIATYGENGLPAETPGDAPNDITFANIERLSVTGSNQNDHIVGTDSALRADSIDSRLPSYTPSGDDVLIGLGGDDFINGKLGDDRIHGGAGDDVLQGTERVRANFNLYDENEIDTLTGGAGADTFVLGVADSTSAFSGVLYRNSHNYNNHPDRAVITDFKPDQGDVIQLRGEAGDYRLAEADGSTFIYFRDGITGEETDELVGEIQGVAGLDLASGAFSYVGADEGPEAVARATFLPRPTIERAGVLDFLQAGALAHAAALATPALAAGFTVTQESGAAVLRAMLDTASGASSSSLELQGSAEAFGTFENDPFGLGSGIILSTGVAEDLPGENNLGSGGTNVTSIPITFRKIGRTGDADIFVADLSNLGVDIRSIKLTDSGSGLGGAGGSASGFDLGAIALSTTLLGSADGLNLDDPAVLPRLDLFDFSNASLTYKPGTQHEAPGNFPYLADLPGSVNGMVDQARVRLDLFNGPFYDDFGDAGTLTLGDSGSIGFDLTDMVTAAGPLYLYIAESGGAGEVVTGAVEVSSDAIEPTGDLSTDLGAPGLGGDATSMTYRFTPRAGDDAFAINAVLFTEELPEFDGTRLTDLFSVRLNGVEIGELGNGAALTIKSLIYSGGGDLVLNEPGTGPLASAIKADAYTRTLRISGDLVPDAENVLTIEVRDGRDGFLDSGLLIQGDSFGTYVRPEISITGDRDAAEPGDCVNYTVSLPDGTALDSPVRITVMPSGNIDLGEGPGKPVEIVFTPDGELSEVICAQVAPGADPDRDGVIGRTVESDDPDFDGAALPPSVIDVLPESETDPYLIFERLSGDVIPDFGPGGDMVDGTARPGPTSFHVEGMATGKDVIRGFDRSDILIVDEEIADGNDDGIITFGRNGVLDLDGADMGADAIRFLASPPRSLRLIGSDDEGRFVYADARARPAGAREGRLGDDALAGDAGDRRAERFFFDTALDVNWGSDEITRFGARDALVTTTKLFDPDEDGRIELGSGGTLKLSGNGFFDPAHEQEQASPGPFGEVALSGVSGAALNDLYLARTVVSGGSTYYHYSQVAPAAPAWQEATAASYYAALLQPEMWEFA